MIYVAQSVPRARLILIGFGAKEDGGAETALHFGAIENFLVNDASFVAQRRFDKIRSVTDPSVR